MSSMTTTICQMGFADCLRSSCRYFGLDSACSYQQEHSAQPKQGRAVRRLKGMTKRRIAK
jgi:hypothetical protein